MRSATRARSILTPSTLLAFLLAAATTTVGIFVLGRASQTAFQHGVFVAVMTTVAAAASVIVLRQRRALRTAVLAGIAGTIVIALIAGGVLSRATSVDERVVVADAVEAAAPRADAPSAVAPSAGAPRNVLVARGSFEPLEHAGRGTASIIRTASGRHVLTLTDFRTDAGPDLYVQLVAGNPRDDADVERGEVLRLGRLKGTSGNQQYELPRGTDPDRFTHAYVWCRAFSVGFTRARLA